MKLLLACVLVQPSAAFLPSGRLSALTSPTALYRKKGRTPEWADDEIFDIPTATTNDDQWIAEGFEQDQGSMKTSRPKKFFDESSIEEPAWEPAASFEELAAQIELGNEEQESMSYEMDYDLLDEALTAEEQEMEVSEESYELEESEAFENDSEEPEADVSADYAEETGVSSDYFDSDSINEFEGESVFQFTPSVPIPEAEPIAAVSAEPVVVSDIDKKVDAILDELQRLDQDRIKEYMQMFLSAAQDIQKGVSPRTIQGAGFASFLPTLFVTHNLFFSGVVGAGVAYASITVAGEPVRKFGDGFWDATDTLIGIWNEEVAPQFQDIQLPKNLADMKTSLMEKVQNFQMPINVEELTNRVKSFEMPAAVKEFAEKAQHFEMPKVSKVPMPVEEEIIIVEEEETSFQMPKELQNIELPDKVKAQLDKIQVSDKVKAQLDKFQVPEDMKSQFKNIKSNIASIPSLGSIVDKYMGGNGGGSPDDSEEEPVVTSSTKGFTMPDFSSFPALSTLNKKKKKASSQMEDNNDDVPFFMRK